MIYLRIHYIDKVWQWGLYKRKGELICVSNHFQRWDALVGSLNLTFGSVKLNVTVDGKHRGTLKCAQLADLSKEYSDESRTH